MFLRPRLVIVELAVPVLSVRLEGWLVLGRLLSVLAAVDFRLDLVYRASSVCGSCCF